MLFVIGRMFCENVD